MKKQLKKIIQISIIISLLFSISTAPVFAAQETDTMKKARLNESAKNRLDWGIQATKAVSKCAIGFGVRTAVSALSGALLKLLSTDVSTHDAKAATAKSLENCITSVATKLAKDQIVKMTRATLNWVNTGLQGDSLYVQDAKALLRKTGNEAISAELSIFRDSQYSEMYPYGRNFGESQIDTARNMNDHLRDLKSTLFDTLIFNNEEVINNTQDKLDTYANNFAVGGWNGWLSLTQNPANNPLGFNMLASDQLAFQREVAIQAIKEEAAAGGGILNAKECVEYGLTKKGAAAKTDTLLALGSDQSIDQKKAEADMTKKTLQDAQKILNDVNSAEDKGGSVWESKLATAKKDVENAQKDYDKAKEKLNKAYIAFNATTDDEGNECTKYTTITPGSVIKDQVSRVLQSPIIQSEMVKTLDDGIGAMMDGLLNKLQENGIKNIDEMYNTAKSMVPGMALNSSGELLMGDDATSNNPGGFDLKDLGSVYTYVGNNNGDYKREKEIDINAYEFIEKTGEYEKITGQKEWRYVKSVDAKGGFTGDYILEKPGVILNQDYYITKSSEFLKLVPDITPSLGELDYCIPGPNPNWEERTQSMYMDIQARDTGETASVVVDDGEVCYNNSEYKAARYIISFYEEYKNDMNILYGPNSDMLNPDKTENGLYLPMASDGQNLTAGIDETAQNALDAKRQYNTYNSEAKSVISELNDIKDKYNAIITSAQARKLAEQNTRITGLTASVKQYCLDVGKIVE
jgi:hypothetical protein